MMRYSHICGLQNASGHRLGARQHFTYISPIGRLKATNANKEYCRLIDDYRSRTRGLDARCSEDVFSGTHYNSLKGKPVTWDGITQQPVRKYFQESTDAVLGLSTDGVPLYKRSRMDAWSLLITNYSLPPEVRTRKGYQLCCGIIPGAHSLPRCTMPS